ncbi:MAG: AmmeMemoRadiSam system radical SAM enzyme [Tissierellia bacterium]|nr:AmmeMemoRadiSam system radical SAM enzyme [Tissierellia bacterium]
MDVIYLRYADYQIRLDRDFVKCKLCPHECKIPPGGKGICNIRKNIDGKLYSLNYGKVLSYAVDPIEKKPLARFHPGSFISSVGTSGCNLKCDFCQNHELVNCRLPNYEISPAELLKLVKRDNTIGLAYTYNEPGIWYEFVLEMAKLIKGENLINVFISNGYIQKEPFENLGIYLDAVNIDLKSMNPSFYREICGADPNPVIQTIKTATNMGIHVEVSTLLISGLNTSTEEINELAKLIAEIDENIPLHLSRYFPAHKRNAPPTLVTDLFKAYSIAKKYLKYVYLGNI